MARIIIRGRSELLWTMLDEEIHAPLAPCLSCHFLWEYDTISRASIDSRQGIGGATDSAEQDRVVGEYKQESRVLPVIPCTEFSRILVLTRNSKHAEDFVATLPIPGFRIMLWCPSVCFRMCSGFFLFGESDPPSTFGFQCLPC